MLQSQAELNAAMEWGVKNTPHYWDRSKDWDTAAIVEAGVLNNPTHALLDMGCSCSMPLHLAKQRGFQRLYGIDLGLGDPAFRYQFRDMPEADIRDGSCTATPWPDSSMDAITCLSVIEHRVSLSAWVAEVTRLLIPGGLLCVTFDYWPSKAREECLDDGELTQLENMLRQSFTFEPVDRKVKDRVIFNLFTFGRLIAVKK
jgi:SAM-dependent methyltransferase